MASIALKFSQSAADTFEDDVLYNFELAPHAMPFGPGPTPGTVWDSESWLAMIEDTDPFEGPSSSVNEHEDDHPTPPTPPKPKLTIHYRVYDVDPVGDDYAAQAAVADPLIDMLAVEGVHVDEMGDGVARGLSDRAIRSIDPGLLGMTDENDFYFLAVDDGGKHDEDLDWIGVDLEKDGDFDVFLGYRDDPDALPVFVTISAEAPKKEDAKVDDADALF